MGVAAVDGRHGGVSFVRFGAGSSFLDPVTAALVRSLFAGLVRRFSPKSPLGIVLRWKLHMQCPRKSIDLPKFKNDQKADFLTDDFPCQSRGVQHVSPTECMFSCRRDSLRSR